jgi:hypothetical protein
MLCSKGCVCTMAIPSAIALASVADTLDGMSDPGTNLATFAVQHCRPHRVRSVSRL